MAAHAFFDLNGTLLDPAPLGEPLGGDPGFVRAVLDDTVRLAMIATVTGSYRDFSELLAAAVRGRLAGTEREALADPVIAAAKRMRPFADVAPAIETLRAAGLGVGVLTNSSSATATELLAGSGLIIDPILGTETVGAFKPDGRVYKQAIDAVGSEPAEVVLITAHWWDALGAKRAGLSAAWVSRKEGTRPAIDPAPDHVAGDLTELARRIVERSGGE